MTNWATLAADVLLQAPSWWLIHSSSSTARRRVLESRHLMTTQNNGKITPRSKQKNARGETLDCWQQETKFSARARTSWYSFRYISCSVSCMRHSTANTIDMIIWYICSKRIGRFDCESLLEPGCIGACKPLVHCSKAFIADCMSSVEIGDELKLEVFWKIHLNRCRTVSMASSTLLIESGGAERILTASQQRDAEYGVVESL